ncbi:DUF4198 domain-containing protein [Rhabdochromatium marinum]|uniref:DUF4198 domain-containing protein n=1 Tax=Rhabdochromatium marinum TaxID=48729 RepID=UPI001908AAB1|nr:DUF4198 domain-containing protein [Rhabdochromatium marinum]MBK1649765.1 ATP-dependent DNA ligase [Rhabdochromatium marinum]
MHHSKILGCSAKYRVCLLLSLLVPITATAHFQELIPATESLEAGDNRALDIQMKFTHPMAGGPVMPMAKPVDFGVLGPEGREDLSEQLTAVEVDEQPAYQATYNIEQPGVYVLFLEPAAYWEPGEGKMIKHYTKTVIDAFGGGGDWDASVGFPVEIRPLTRPYGLWSGNVFQGVVQQDGQPVPFAEVEVEWRNDGTVTPPTDAFVTQVIKADANGTFTYAMPRAGWWGFAALLEGAEPLMNPDGESVPVEAGALLWVRVRDMPVAD